LILDREGRWCDIPCASDSSSLQNLVKLYFKPRVRSEIQRLEKIRALMDSSHGAEKDTVLGVGLFYYEPPESGMFEEEKWKGEVVDSMRAAGLSVEPIPPHLTSSLHPCRDNFLDIDVDPLDYYPVSSLITSIFVLCPALSHFEPGLLSGKTFSIGYRAAVGVDGTALLGLLRKREIQTDQDHPEYSRVFVKTIHNAIKKMLK